MAKILITADTHIHNYANHNLFGDADFRLKQFPKLAKRLVELGEEYGCDYIFHLGDIIHKPLLLPKTAGYVKEYFEILSDKWDRDHTYLIYGNHDISNKSANQERSDSILYAFDNYYTYADGKVIQLGSSKIEFMNWKPGLIKASSNPDLFAGHITLDEMYGQEVDANSWKLCVAGDIHQPKSMHNNCLTVNVPMPARISDCQDGSVIIYDTETKKAKRVLTESEDFKYLKIYYEDDADYDENNDFHVGIPRPQSIEGKEYLSRELDLDLVISSVIKEASKDNPKLEELHKAVSDKLQDTTEALNLRFKLNSIEIKNFRSLRQFEYRFQDGLASCSDKNGAGKSSFLRAIEFTLNPPRQVKPLVTKGESDMQVDLDLDYQGNNFLISRGVDNGSHWMRLFINNQEVEANSVTDKQAILVSRLPFINELDIMYRAQSAPNLLSDYNYSNRIDLVNRLLGLSIIDEYYKLSNTLLKSEQKKLNTAIADIDKYKAVLSAMGNIDTEALRAEISSLLTVESDLKAAVTKQFELTSLLEEAKKVTAINNEIDKLNHFITSSSATIDFNLLSIDLKLIQTDLNNIIKSKDSIASEINSLSTELTKSSSVLKDYDNKIKIVESQLEKIKSGTCPTCNQPVHDNQLLEKTEKELSTLLTNREAALELDKQLQDKLTTAKNSSETEIPKLASAESELRDLIAKVEHAQKTQESLNLERDKVDKLESDLAKLPQLDEYAIMADYRELADKIAALKVDNAKFQELNKTYLNVKQSEEGLEKAENSKLASEELIKDYTDYASLFHPTGSVVKSVFSKIAEVMSDTKFIVRTVKTLASKETRIDFDIDYQVASDLLLPYSELSGGQKTLVDMIFLKKLFKMSGGVGMLLLDETLRDLDPDNLEYVSHELKSCNAQTVILVTHVEGYSYADSVIKLT